MLPGTPEYYSLAVTFRCNSRCATCGIWNTSPEPELRTDQWRSFFQDALVRKARSIEFTGGEPTLREDFPKLIEYAYESCPKATVRVGTNGIHSEKVIELAETFKHEGIYFALSIDGVGELHDRIRGIPNNFNSIMVILNHIRELQEEGYQVGAGASICVSKLNLDRIPELTRFLEEKHIEYQLTPYLATRYGQWEHSRVSRENLDFITRDERAKAAALFSKYQHQKTTYQRFIKFWNGEEWEKPPCYVLTRGAVSVRPNGDIPLCMQRDREVIVGNICEQPFSAIWYGERAKRLRQQYKNCKACYHPNMCDLLNNYAFHGWAYRDTILQQPSLSSLVKKTVEVLLR